MEPGSYEGGNDQAKFEDLAFMWAMESYDDLNNQFNIQINFTSAIKISPDLVPDILSIEVNDPSRFQSKKYGKPLEMEGRPIMTPVMKQMPNTVAA